MSVKSLISVSLVSISSIFISLPHREDMYAQDSIDMLHQAGIQFKRHEDEGISVDDFAELLISSGLVLCEDVTWIAFARSVNLNIDYFHLYSSIQSTIYPSIQSTIYPSIQPTINPSIHSSNQPSIHPSNQPSIHLSIHPINHLSIYPSIQPTNHQSIYPFIYSLY